MLLKIIAALIFSFSTLAQVKDLKVNLLPVSNGFKVLSVAKGSFFSKIGIKKNDIIKSINGKDIGDPVDGMKAFNALQDSDKVDILVLRKGKEKKIHLDIK